MKIAVITDIGSAASYVAKDKKVYTLSGEPHYAPAFISNEWLMGFWNIPVIFDGMFINIRHTKLPDEKFDLILAAIERDANNIYRIREKYPHAVIYGMIKEDYGDPRVRKVVLDNTVGYIQPFLKEQVIDTGRKSLIRLGQPINIEYLRSHFYGNKNNTVFNYSNHWAASRVAMNRPFLSKVTTEVVTGKTKSSNPNQILDFFNMWKDSQYMVNFDKQYSVGQMATQCASLGTIMLGGNNDGNLVLFPMCSGMNYDHVYNEYDQMQKNDKYKQAVIDYAFDKLNEIYSFAAVKKQILNLI